MAAENELCLYITNDGDLYRQFTRPLQKQLAAAKKAGTYDRAEALKRFHDLARVGATKYKREFRYDTAPQTTSANSIRACAKDMLEYFEIEHGLGNMKP